MRRSGSEAPARSSAHANAPWNASPAPIVEASGTSRTGTSPLSPSHQYCTGRSPRVRTTRVMPKPRRKPATCSPSARARSGGAKSSDTTATSTRPSRGVSQSFHEPPSSTRRCGGCASRRAKGSSPSTSGTPSVSAACASAGLCPSMRTTPTRSGSSAATRPGSASSRAFVEATMRPLGCSMIEETAGSRRDEAGAAPRSPRADG